MSPVLSIVSIVIISKVVISKVIISIVVVSIHVAPGAVFTALHFHHNLRTGPIS
jgi:hypothetical protein